MLKKYKAADYQLFQIVKKKVQNPIPATKKSLDIIKAFLF